MNNLKKLIVLLAFAMTFTACKKPADKAETQVESTEKTENTEQKSEAKETESKEEVTVSQIKSDFVDFAYPLQDLGDGNKYIELDSFSAYLEPTKHRFSIKANDKNKRITMKLGMFNTEHPNLGFELKDVVEDVYELRLDDKSEKYTIKTVAGVYWVKIQDAMQLFDFSLDGENLVFANPDTKKMENANNRDYDWYEDQGHTGEYNEGNCGPTSMAMALKWIDPNSTKTGESCRSDVPNDGEWWNTNIVEDYFKANNVKFDSVFYKYPELITNEIDKGNIVYVCAIMKEVTYNPQPDSSKFGRFYKFDGGHFFLIKGYKVIDGVLYFEVYDPNTWDMKYSETGEPMGKDRLYAAQDVDKAIKNWYMTVYSIYPNAK